MKRCKDGPTPAQQRKIRADQRLICRLKQEFGVDSDLALAKRMRIPPTTLGRVVRGEATLSWENRASIGDKLGFAVIRNAMCTLLPSKLSTTLISASHRQFMRGFEVEDQGDLTPAIRLLEFFNLSTYPGFAEVIIELERLRPLNEIREEGEFTVKERALILETLFRANPKVWQCLIDELADCVCSTNHLCEVVSLTVGDHTDLVNTTNQLIDAIATKFSIETNACIAEELGITPGTLSNVKKGRGSLPARAAFKLKCLLDKDSLESARRAFAQIDDILSDSRKFIEGC